MVLSSSLKASRGPRPPQRAGLRRHLTASWAYLFRLIKRFSSSSSSVQKPWQWLMLLSSRRSGVLHLLWRRSDNRRLVILNPQTQTV